MSPYTLRGSAQLDARIDADLARIRERAAPHAAAGILIGGYGRGEGTPFILPDGTQAPFNDYDLVVVVDRLDPAVRNRFRSLEKTLSRELGLDVDLCPYLRRALPRCEFSLLNFEMKYGHRVLWGDPHILGAMPDYPRNAIPRTEGTRLLLNRGKLLLDLRERLARTDPLTDEERVRFIKFIHKAWLAFGDCALLVTGQYDLAYAVKRQRIHSIPGCPCREAVITGFLQAVDLKEWGDFQALADYDVAGGSEAVRDQFLRFFPWYRAQADEGEGTALKNLARNLAGNRCLCTRHPRERLYDALPHLLRGEGSAQEIARFHQLRRRFS